MEELGMGKRYTREFKVGLVERMLAGENVSALSRDYVVPRSVLYEWRRAYQARGPSGLRGIGRPGGAAVASGSGPEERIAALERKIGQQQLELDFFRHALLHLEAFGQADATPGGTASTASSGPGRGGKAD